MSRYKHISRYSHNVGGISTLYKSIYLKKTRLYFNDHITFYFLVVLSRTVRSEVSDTNNHTPTTLYSEVHLTPTANPVTLWDWAKQSCFVLALAGLAGELYIPHTTCTTIRPR